MPQTGGEFKQIVPTTLIAGGFKLDQLLADPFQTFYAMLIRHTHEADAILIAGYGFGDVHVNRALQNRCTLFPRNPLSRPPVAVITKTADFSIGWTGHRNDLWEWELTHSLNASFHAKAPTQTFEQLVRQNEPEIGLQKRVAIWHGGFLVMADRTRFGDFLVKDLIGAATPFSICRGPESLL